MNVQISPVINAVAKKYGINPRLIAALIYKESSGNPHAWRPEPGFWAKYLKNKKPGELKGFVPENVPTVCEVFGRSCSWGLCQVMGETAREMGFEGEYFGELSNPDVGIELGIKYLRQCMGEDLDISRGLQWYNGGGNPNYSAEVLALIDSPNIDFLLGAKT